MNVEVMRYMIKFEHVKIVEVDGIGFGWNLKVVWVVA